MGETRVCPFADQHRKRHGRQFLSVLPRRLRAAALLQTCRRKLTGLERCMTIDPQACTKTVKGYGELTTVTSSLDKSTYSLEVEHSFNRTVTALFPFSAVWLEQATRSFHGDGRRTFSVRSRRRCTAPGRSVHSTFQRFFSIEVLCLSLESPDLQCKTGKIQLQVIPKFVVGVCKRNQAMQWRSRKELQMSS